MSRLCHNLLDSAAPLFVTAFQALVLEPRIRPTDLLTRNRPFRVFNSAGHRRLSICYVNATWIRLSVDMLPVVEPVNHWTLNDLSLKLAAEVEVVAVCRPSSAGSLPRGVCSLPH